MSEEILDWLAETCLIAIVRVRPDLTKWRLSKAEELRGLRRLDILRWMAFELDVGNQEIVAPYLGFDASPCTFVRRRDALRSLEKAVARHLQV